MEKVKVQPEHALTQKQLDEMGCSMPNCAHDHSILIAAAACHPKAGVEATYVKADGVLILKCMACKRGVGVFAIAAGKPTN